MKRSVALFLVVLCACGGSDPKPSDGRPPAVTLIAQHIPLFAGETRALRIGFRPAGEAAFARVQFEPDSARVSACPLPSLDAPVARASCRSDIGSGVREPVTASGMHAIAIVLDGPEEATADIRIEYDEAARDVALRLPLLRAPDGSSPCKDNACNPFFEVVPVRGGSFRARATWSGASATLVLLQGSVLGRSETSTGLPYREAARADGRSPLEISTRMSAPGEYALAFRHRAQGGAPLSGVAIDATWP